MLSVVCVKWGDKYSHDYVNKLYNMVKRNLSQQHEFICMTEDSEGLDKNIRILPFPDDSLFGWWNKLTLYKPGIIEGKMLYLDLDVVIVDEIDSVVDYGDDEDFCIINHFYRPYIEYNSSVMKCIPANFEVIWQSFCDNKPLLMERQKQYPTLGDQDVITKVMVGRPIVKLFPLEWIWSYKIGETRDIAMKERYTKGGEHVGTQIPKDGKVCIFHGSPNPDEVDEDWIVKHWIAA